jgi:ribose transport system ATP-binding protein
MPSPILQTEQLTKSFVGKPVLTALDLTVERGEVHALLGENGSGKSTLIKILSGYHAPDPHGRVLVDGQPLTLGSPAASHTAGLRFVHQDLGLIDSESISDNLALSTGFATRLGTVRRRAARDLAARDLARVGLDADPSLPVGQLSPAQKTGVAIARALAPSPDAPVRLLVLDEPTAALPQAEVEHLLAMIRTASAAGVGVLYVTHRLDEVFRVAHRVTVLRDGRKQATVRTSAVDRRGLIKLLIGTELDEVKIASAEVQVTGGTPVLRVRALQAASLAGVGFEARPGDIVGVAGITGSGRDSLLGAIYGARDRHGGEVAVNGAAVLPGRPDLARAAGMAYVPPDRKLFAGIMTLSARENISLSDLRPFWKHGLLRRGAERAEVSRWFERLSIRPPALDAPLATFSGGNQQKIVIAKWLRRDPAVLLLDEPTQGVDIAAKAQLHQEILAVAQAGCAVVISSSDLDEIVALCHRVLVLRDGRLVAHLAGESLTVQEVTHAVLGNTVLGNTAVLGKTQEGMSP